MNASPALPPLGACMLARAALKSVRSPRLHAKEFSTEFRLDQLDAGHIARYKQAMGFGGEAMPLTYLYLLAQRAQLASMLSPHFAFKVVGLVHVDNALAVHEAFDIGLPLAVRTAVTSEAPTESGAVFLCFTVRFLQSGHEVAVCTSRYLAKRGRSGKNAGRAREADLSGGMPEIGRWVLAADSGRRYAALSGDYNPIHLWRWSARLLGLRHPIIHGMQTVGRALACLESKERCAAVAITADFRKPVELGATVVLCGDAHSSQFEVWADSVLSARGHVIWKISS